MIDAHVLGQLIFLQSSFDVMPDSKGVVALVCTGLKQVPGVESVRFVSEEMASEPDYDRALCVHISSKRSRYGMFVFACSDAELFTIYKAHIQNVANTVALVFDNRGYIGEINRQRKQLEQRVSERSASLAHSEQRFRSVVETARDAILSMDETGHITMWNSAAADMFGYDAEAVIGEDLHELIVPERFRDGARRGMAHFQHSGGGKNLNKTIEVQAVRCDGSEFPAELSLSAMKIDSGWHSIGMIRDITERKQIEYLAECTSEILEMVATAQPAEEIYSAICHVFEERFPGMRSSILRLQGDHLFHCSAPSLPEAYSQAIDGIAIGPCVGSCGTAAYLGKEVIVEDIANDPLWADFKALALAHNLLACWSEPIMGGEGKVLGTFAMYFDQPRSPSTEALKEIRHASGLVSIVMERERREAMLSKLSQAVDHAGSSMLITNSDGIIEYVNAAFSRLTGYSAEEAIGQTPRVLKSGKQAAGFYEAMWHDISSGMVWQGKVVDRKKDGTLFSAMLNIAPIRGESGEITNFVGSHADLSELEAMEEQFHQAQKMEAVGTLVGGIAHDFNNMLAGMTGNIYLSKLRVADMPDVVQKLDNIDQLATRAADMIQQMLTFARKDRVSIKRFPLTPFIEETLKFLRPSVPENIAMHEDICSEPLPIDGDSTQLHQVLMNLVNNARDALDGVDAPSMTIGLNVFRADAAWLDAHVDCDGELYAHLSVTDNGCGIAKAQIQHLFEPFFTTKEVGKGTGLGLAMVFGAIKTHHGIVDVESSPGQGSSFHIYLPLPEPEGTSSREDAEEASVSEGNGEMILLADDDDHIIETGKEVLESLGYRVLTARNGEQAVELFTGHADDIDLCLFDIVMPVMGGDEAANRIRKIKPDTKIIFATGYDKNIQDHLKGETVISKPYAIIELSHLIRTTIDGSIQMG